MTTAGSRSPPSYRIGAQDKVRREQALFAADDLAFSLWGEVILKGLLEK